MADQLLTLTLTLPNSETKTSEVVIPGGETPPKLNTFVQNEYFRVDITDTGSGGQAQSDHVYPGSPSVFFRRNIRIMSDSQYVGSPTIHLLELPVTSNGTIIPHSIVTQNYPGLDGLSVTLYCESLPVAFLNTETRTLTTVMKTGNVPGIGLPEVPEVPDAPNENLTTEAAPFGRFNIVYITTGSQSATQEQLADLMIGTF